MLAKLFLQYVLAITFGVGVDEGYATLYGTPGDPLDGDTLACGGAVIPQDKPLCAHRWLPCGTEITVVNLERPGATVCQVADRGPYGVDVQSGRWRGVIDLTPHAARAAKLDGRDFTRLIYKLPDTTSRVYENTKWLVPKVAKRGPAM